MNCKLDHSTRKDILEGLPTRQKGPGRHKCAGCAYDKGFDDGLNEKMIVNITTILNNLPESQKGYQRHKDPHLAYIKGYYDGLSEKLKK